MNDMFEAQVDQANSGAMAKAIGAHELVEQLETRCRKAWQSGGSTFPPALGWIMLDEMRDHRGQIGFSGLENLVQAVHERCRAQLDATDITARFGLDAIGVILDPDDGERDYERTARDITKVINGNLFELDQHSIAASVSMVIRPIREALRPAEINLVRIAATAEALSGQGGNRFDIGTTEVTDGDAPGALLGQLAKAIRNNSLKVVSQPFMSTTNPARERCQLFPRLVAADGSLIPAARFIPIAAERGVLPALDQWMVGHAIEMLNRKLKAGVDLPRLFLAQSTAIIDDADMFAEVRDRIKKLAPDHRLLVLEFSILELKPRIREARKVFTALKKLGLRISLSGIDEKVPDAVLLKHLPADYLKMKADFAHRVLDDEGLAERFNAFADQARQAGRQLIVPMLEDAESVSRIWQMNVDLIQGNFIQQPVDEVIEA